MFAKIYYTIWSDGIKQMEIVGSKKTIFWKLYLNLIISSAMFVKLLFISAIVPKKFIWDYILYLKIDYFKGYTLDALFNGLILTLIFFLVNYFLVFRNDRYKTFMEDYKFYHGKYCLRYIVASFYIPIGILLAGMIYVNYF